MHKKKGETILEILVAMTVLVIIILSTYTILMQAMRTNTSIKDRIIALNLAREGLEGVRSIRDTNWLRYSGDRRRRWLCRDAFVQVGTGNPYAFGAPISNADLYIPDGPTSLIRSCAHVSSSPGSAFPAHDEIIESGAYILQYIGDAETGPNYNPGEIFNQYILEPKINATIINEPNNFYWDGTGSMGEAGQEEFRLYIESHRNGLQNRYSHNSTADETLLPIVENEASRFYRKIIVDRVSPLEDPDNPGLELDDDFICEDDCETAKIKVTSLVEWQDDRENWQYIELETHLFDFYQRTDY